jgi:hypothetical protein
VQPIPRHQRGARQPRLDCAAHECKAGKKADTFLSRCIGNDRLHTRMLRGGKHDRRILQVHKNHFGAASFKRANTLSDPVIKAFDASAPNNIVRAQLPNDKIGPVGEDVTLEARYGAAIVSPIRPLLMISIRAVGHNSLSPRRITSG